jgi:hypothetical protein
MELNVNGLGLPRMSRLIVNTMLNGPVTTRGLISVVWPDHDKQPINPSNSISMYISGIRNALQGVGWRIRCEAGVYHIEPGPRLTRAMMPNTKDVPRYAARAKTKATIPAVAQLFDVIDGTGMTMRAVQEQSLVSMQTLAHWRTGATVPYMREFFAVADMLGYDIILKKRE